MLKIHKVETNTHESCLETNLNDAIAEIYILNKFPENKMVKSKTGSFFKMLEAVFADLIGHYEDRAFEVTPRVEFTFRIINEPDSSINKIFAFYESNPVKFLKGISSKDSDQYIQPIKFYGRHDFTRYRIFFDFKSVLVYDTQASEEENSLCYIPNLSRIYSTSSWFYTKNKYLRYGIKTITTTTKEGISVNVDKPFDIQVFWPYYFSVMRLGDQYTTFNKFRNKNNVEYID